MLVNDLIKQLQRADAGPEILIDIGEPLLRYLSNEVNITYNKALDENIVVLSLYKTYVQT